MRYILIILLLIFSGCSAQWHVRRALQIDSTILNTKYDSTRTIDINYSDSIYYFTRSIKVLHESDTGHVRDTFPNTTGDTLKVTSDDSTAHARAYYDSQGLLNLQTWSMIDKLIRYEDSIKLQNKTITHKDRIIEQREATIQKKKSFISQLQTYLVIGIVVIFVIIIVIFISKLS